MAGDWLDAARKWLTPLAPLSTRTLLEIGAAYGSNVPWFEALGFHRERLTLNELRMTHAARAKDLWPGATVVAGDAADLELPAHDVVFAATVLTSIPDPAHRQRVAHTMWRLARAGVLLYDFTIANPWGAPNTRSLPLREIRQLFPRAHITYQRVTLFPPLARRVSPAVGRVLAHLPLRFHVVAWLAKG